MVFQNIMMGAAGQGGGYDIDQSIRFNAADSAYLTRTPGSASNRKTWTFSFWWKVNTLASATGAGYRILQANSTEFGWSDSNDNLYLIDGSVIFQTTQVFRDTTAWQHIVLAVDTTDSTAGDRVKLYINGSQVTSFVSGPTVAQDFTFDVNDNTAQNIGKEGSNYLDAYVAEIQLVDGTQLAASSFGETNSDGVWIPKAYAGAYGTNGFFIDGRDSADLGDDESGNGNDFTSSGLAAADQMLDTPTDNFPTFSNNIRGLESYGPSTLTWGNSVNISDGGLKMIGATAGANLAGATMALPSSGKYYFEATFIGADSSFFGISPLYDESKIVWYRNNGWTLQNATSWTTSGGATYTNTDVLAISVNMDDLEAKFYKNNALQITISLTAGVEYIPTAFGGNNTLGFTFNFGASAFTYTPPTGFVALSTANLPTPTITDGSQYFHTQTYTGTGSSGLAITNDANFGDFQPDMLLLAPRSNGDNHVMWDVARGVTSRMRTNDSAAQDTDGTALLTFEADGFDLDTTDPNYNGSARTYVAWQWKTQGGAGSSNTAGSINTTTTSVNTTAGISISTFEGNGTAGQTIGHGIGVTPSWIVIKNRDNTEQWVVYHSALGATKYIMLNSTGAVGDSDGAWNDTEPTSTLITLGGGGFGTNVSGDSMVCYAFAEIEGYSRFGTYEGNGNADGAFIYTGFRPSWIMCKSVDSTSDWFIFDSKRLGYNVDNNSLFINDQGSELTADNIDILSNGFKMRVATDPNVAETYIYMAFAEYPFGGDGVAPATAR